MATHTLKTSTEPFQAIVDGRKRFEYRLDDRHFTVGDELDLREWNPISGNLTGCGVSARVTYLLRGPIFGIPRGYVVMSIRKGFEAMGKHLGICWVDGGPCEGQSTDGQCQICNERDALRSKVERLTAELRVAKATHRCKVCGAKWILFPASISPPGVGATWSLASATCGKCCDNVEMGDQIEPIGLTAEVAALRARVGELERLVRAAADTDAETLTKLRSTGADYVAMSDVIACFEERHAALLEALSTPSPTGQTGGDGPKSQLASTHLERDAVLADAERFRWLLDGNGYYMEEEELCGHAPCDDEEKALARADIDAAIKRSAK